MSINDLQEKLGILLPPWYRSFLEDYPQKLKEARHEDWEGVPVSDWEFYNDPERLLELNLETRKDDASFIAKGIQPIPPEYFMIGQDLGGGLFMIDIEDPKENVYYFPGGGSYVRFIAESLDEAIEDVLKSNRE